MESSFGERMQHVHATLRQRFDKLSRVAIAIYDPHTDRLKTFAHSTEGSSPLVQYEVKLSEVPSLRYLAEHKQPRVLDRLDSLLGSSSEHSRKLLEAGYASSYTEPLLFNSKLFGFLFCDAMEPGLQGAYSQRVVSLCPGAVGHHSGGIFLHSDPWRRPHHGAGVQPLSG